MTDPHHLAIGRQARRAAGTSSGPTAERYQSALARYLAAVAGEPATPPQPGEGPTFWNLDNNLVSDVMTAQVVTALPSTTFRDIVDTLVAHRISALPVIDGDRHVLGVVSESDLLAKVVAGGTPYARTRAGHAERERTRRRSGAETAGELMTSPAITVERDASVVHAARMAAIEHVRRLPVVDGDGVLVGIVTRSDLLRIFLRGDEQIYDHIVRELVRERFHLDSSAISVRVQDGVVTLHGQLPRRLTVAPLLDAVRATAGVVAVHDELTYLVDDTVLPARAGRPTESSDS